MYQRSCTNVSRQRRRILAIRDLLHRDVLVAVLVRLKLVDVYDEHITLHIHQHEARRGFRLLLLDIATVLAAAARAPPPAAQGARDAARVDEELALHLVGLEAVRAAAPQQHVDVHLARGDEQAVGIPERQDGVAVGEADAQRAVLDDLGQRQRRGGRVDVEVALDEL
ncbi:hypothetical protein FH972_025940 [Carpinus fangiana]|uniref:Uncharacterized protein n=1 Tax=Carpinus fangiana TaxID=176857 RepID=A0A5N6L538_9ROSI|nr:hypothetical protein FH972_025940 [Carpinus fangiana]